MDEIGILSFRPWERPVFMDGIVIFCRSVHEKGPGFMDEIELSGAGAKK